MLVIRHAVVHNVGNYSVGIASALECTILSKGSLNDITHGWDLLLKPTCSWKGSEEENMSVHALPLFITGNSKENWKKSHRLINLIPSQNIIWQCIKYHINTEFYERSLVKMMRECSIYWPFSIGVDGLM